MSVSLGRDGHIGTDTTSGERNWGGGTGMTTVSDRIRSTIRTVADFPKAGILFYDITPVLQDSEGFRQIIEAMAARYRGRGLDAVVGIDARGFIFGACLAFHLEKPFVLVRKPGKLPPTVERVDYLLEYGSGTLEMSADALQRGDKVVIVDDLLATGGTAAGAVQLVGRLGATVLECCFLVELVGLHGAEAIGVPYYSFVQYHER